MYMGVYKDNFNILAFSTIYNDKSIISQNMEEKNRWKNLKKLIKVVYTMFWKQSSLTDDWNVISIVFCKKNLVTCIETIQIWIIFEPAIQVPQFMFYTLFS